MNNDAREIFDLLRNKRFMLSNEKSVQADIEKLFKSLSVSHKREHILDENNIIDFLMDNGVGIEVKIKGQKRAMYKQCERYAQFEDIKQLILLTSVSTGMPQEINNKPIHVLNLSRAWL